MRDIAYDLIIGDNLRNPAIIGHTMWDIAYNRTYYVGHSL